MNHLPFSCLQWALGLLGAILGPIKLSEPTQQRQSSVLRFCSKLLILKGQNIFCELHTTNYILRRWSNDQLPISPGTVRSFVYCLSPKSTGREAMLGSMPQRRLKIPSGRKNISLLILFTIICAKCSFPLNTNIRGGLNVQAAHFLSCPPKTTFVAVVVP